MKRTLSLLLAFGTAVSCAVTAFAEEPGLVIGLSGTEATEEATEITSAPDEGGLAEEWTPTLSEEESEALSAAIADAEAANAAAPAELDAETVGSSADSVVIDEDTSDAYTYTNNLEGFVDRMYRVVLNRDPDAAGRADWVSRLRTGTARGADIIYGFFASVEYKARNRTTTQMVTDAYNAVLGRAPELAGFTDWVNAINEGMTAVGVAAGFCGSQEFANLCASYGITAGTFPAANMEPRDRSHGVTAFVSRLYTKCLGRSYDVKGLNDWCTVLLNGTSTGATVAGNFVFSTEYTNKHVSNTDYITMLYSTFLNRAPDLQGAMGWLEKLNYTNTRAYVMNQFIGSPEFNNICKGYGITLGGSYPTVDDTESWKMNVLMLNYINSERIAAGMSISQMLKLNENVYNLAFTRAKELPVRSAELVQAGGKVGTLDDSRPNNQGTYQTLYKANNMLSYYIEEARASAPSTYTPRSILTELMKNSTYKGVILSPNATTFACAYVYQTNLGWYALEFMG